MESFEVGSENLLQHLDFEIDEALVSPSIVQSARLQAQTLIGIPIQQRRFSATLHLRSLSSAEAVPAVPFANRQPQPVPDLDHQHLDLYHSQLFDEGADEFEVAEERAHLFGENVNADIMTYEQLIELQDRIGYVNKGMKVREMNKFPQMIRKHLRRYIKRKNNTGVSDGPRY